MEMGNIPNSKRKKKEHSLYMSHQRTQTIINNSNMHYSVSVLGKLEYFSSDSPQLGAHVNSVDPLMSEGDASTLV
jgi:hypothetical protein